MDAYDNTMMDRRFDAQNIKFDEQNRLLMCIGTALERIADKLEAIEISVRKN
jgi:hypothetical protein